METVICYKTKDGKIFQEAKEATIHEAEYNFKKALYELGSLYDNDMIDNIFNDWKDIYMK